MITAIQGAVVGLGMDRPRLVMLLTVLVTVVLAAAIVRVDVDTDPENMLPGDDPVPSAEPIDTVGFRYKGHDRPGHRQ